MGTSSSSGGPGSNTSLVPTFLEPISSDPLPGGEAEPADSGEDGDGEAPGDGLSPAATQAPRPTIQPPPAAGRYTGARTNFTRFASSGGNDRRALRRAVRDYVRSGAGGSHNATRKMGSAREAASGALGVFRGFQRDGVADTLARLNLGNLVGRPTREVFIGLTDIICRDGGPIDEGIARDAWLETCVDLEQIGIDNLDALTAEQIRDVFLAFIAHAIEARLFQEIGVNGFEVADLNAIQAFEAQFRSYVERDVRDSFASDFSSIAELSDAEIRTIVDQTYQNAWELFETWGDQS
ncbi:hypothetical protein ACM43_12895 [Bradyrhizobium sp. CCBAU 45321]|uniref:Qat anti-phage system associated protein QatB n=1 Tax=Bradyrhizobium sp. CCBAU 45321 TaxID=1641878 RepID=UPI0023023E81|nr:Qat anti-phage system associated protein QatB [Bradyrhizobium sp. CCBAU 45321]MDA9545321.1 hypothetical protein [Bradyrhizobium sp. CCBAU 45321]